MHKTQHIGKSRKIVREKESSDYVLSFSKSKLSRRVKSGGRTTLRALTSIIVVRKRRNIQLRTW